MAAVAHLMGIHNNVCIYICMCVYMYTPCRHDAMRDVIFHALLVDNKGTVREQRCCSVSLSFIPILLLGVRPTSLCLYKELFSAAVCIEVSAGAAAFAGESEKDDLHEAPTVDYSILSSSKPLSFGLHQVL